MSNENTVDYWVMAETFEEAVDIYTGIVAEPNTVSAVIAEPRVRYCTDSQHADMHIVAWTKKEK